MSIEVGPSIFTSLFVDRGIGEAKMTTLSVAVSVKKDVVYQIGPCGVEVAKSSLFPIDMESRASSHAAMELPAHLSIPAVWDKKAIQSGDGNNILGDNGTLVLPMDLIEIPVVPATEETLLPYGAILFKRGDKVMFPDDDYPLFRMNVGEKYSEEFVMSERGGGVYLEYHYDKPHFHMPQKGGGYYILAKWDKSGTELNITAFQIADGDAVYTKKGAIHCDAFLTGDLLVGYTLAKDCSTVLLRTSDGKMVSLRFS